MLTFPDLKGHIYRRDILITGKTGTRFLISSLAANLTFSLTHTRPTVQQKTLKSGCLSLLTIQRFWHSRRVRAVVRVWLGFGFGVSVSAIDSLSDAV
eukprot:sb/3478991/